jgi:hypothetical protein
MALAIPGGAPGYDYDKENGNNVAHDADLTSQRLREHRPRRLVVKAMHQHQRDFVSVAGFLRFGEW